MPILYIPAGNLITFKDKYIDTLKEIEKGELSYSYGYPCTVSYCPDLRKYLIQDGNHRAIEKLRNGYKKIPCEINQHVPKYYPTGELVTINNKKQFSIQEIKRAWAATPKHFN